jgi:hypothetical protein
MRDDRGLDHFEADRLEFGISGWAPAYVSWHPDARRFAGTGRGAARAPSAGEWAAFWVAIDAIGVWGWDGHLATFAVCDAGGWVLELARGDRAIRSSGNGSVHPPGWGEFLSALAALIGDDRLRRRADIGPPDRRRAGRRPRGASREDPPPPRHGPGGSGSTGSHG